MISSYDQPARSEEHTSELQSRENLVCRLLLEKKKNNDITGCLEEQQISDVVFDHTEFQVDCTNVVVFPWIGMSFDFLDRCLLIVFFFNDTATTEIYTLSLHDALPI